MVAVLGQGKYDEEIGILKKVAEQEKNKGTFQSISGDIDSRSNGLKDVQLSSGFENVQCGIRGSKLSGGQK